MSYLVLARKYRPQTFSDVVGQKPIVKTLQNSLRLKRIAHAILFSGVRGVGKTTLARIMAKAINCESKEDNKPCNSCRSCQEMTQGQSLDLHEIDGASNRGIQEIRELKEKIRFLPSSSQYKIIIIDEVHMLTTEAFNALLKTLEEPPEHVYFMFATTEIHKIPITILSRCQRYELKRVTSNDLMHHFHNIANQEEVSIEQSALSMIVREAGGSVRDGLSLLDQMFSYGDSSISHADIVQVLGLTDRSILSNITKALLTGERQIAIRTLDAAFEYGIDIKRFTSDLLENFRGLLLLKMGNCNELLDLPEEEIQLLKEIAESHSFETIHFKMNLFLEATEGLRHTTQPRLALETAFLKIIEAGNVVPTTAIIEKLGDLLQTLPDDQAPEKNEALPQKKNDSVRDQPSPPPPIEPERVENLQPPQQKEAVNEPLETSSEPVEERVKTVDQSPPPPLDDFTETTPPPPPGWSEKEESQPEEEAASLPSSPPVNDIEPHPHIRDVRRDWLDFTAYVKERKVWMAQDLQRAESAKEVEGELHLQYTDPATCTLLRSKENKKLLTEFVLDFFQKDLTVRFILPELNGNGENGDDSDSPHKQRQQLINDPLVQMAVEIFNGHVGDIRIGPRSR